MRGRSFLNKRLLLAGAGVLVALLAAVLWLEREPLLAWHYLRGLAAADEAQRDAWVEHVAGLDAAAVPGLVRCLERQDARACDNAWAALTRITQGWPESDPRWYDLAERLAASFPRQGTVCRPQTLQRVADWLRTDPSPPSAALLECAGRLLLEARRTQEPEVLGAALSLAGALLGQACQERHRDLCRELAERGLRDVHPEVRCRAVRLACGPGLNMTREAAALLNDPAPEVRRAVMAGVGPSPEAIGADDLITWLHDADAEVRQLCEAALLARDDFKPEHLPLARLITAPKPGLRLQVVEHLLRDGTVEPGIWLRRLSHDPAPEVRAAAVRAAASQSVVDLSDRIDQMAQSDPSPTVAQLAQYYLSHRQKR